MVELWVFVAALVAVYLVPGPDMILLLHTGASHGRTHAVATALGLAVARAAHVTLAGAGLAALLRTAPLAFEIVRIAGAGYLIWLGVAMLRTRVSLTGAAAPTADGMRRSLLLAAQRGLLTNLLNPKALLFCSVLLPQFVQPGHDVAVQFLLLGVILVLTGIAFDMVYATLGTTLGRWLARYPGVQVAQRWVFGSLLVGFGVRLALGERI